MACVYCDETPPDWMIFVPLRPPSQNESMHHEGAGRFMYRKLRTQWVGALVEAMTVGPSRPVPIATGPRRLVMTRLYGGREQERDYGNMVGGMKLVIDAMRPTRMSKIASGKRKGEAVTTHGAGLILDDCPSLLVDVYRQKRVAKGVRTGLQIEIVELAAIVDNLHQHAQPTLSFDVGGHGVERP